MLEGVELWRGSVGAAGESGDVTSEPSWQERHQLVVHDLDDLLAGPDFLERGDADGPGLHPLEEFAREVEADVSLEQDPADFPEPLFDRVFRQDTAYSELPDRVVESPGSSSNISP